MQPGNATFIALASWANQTVNISLQIDWAALGLTAKTAVCAPQVLGVQMRSPDGSTPAKGVPVVADFGDGPIEVQPHSGWWLLLTTRKVLECNGTRL